MGLLDFFSGIAGGGSKPDNIAGQQQLYTLGNKTAAGGVDLNWQFADMLNRYRANPLATQNAPYSTAQNGLVQQLQQSASGAGPSIVQPTVDQNRDKNIAAAMAMSNSANGNQNAGLLQKSTADQVGAINQNAAHDATMARLQEIFNARNQLGTANMQGAGMNINTTNADQGLQNNILQMAMQREQEQANLNKAQADQEYQMKQQQNKAAAGMVGGVGAFGGQFMGMGNKQVDTSASGGDMGNSSGGGSSSGDSGSGAASGGMAGMMGGMMYKGGKVPGKSAVEGDSPANDTVHIKVSPGEIVIPRTVVKKGPEAMHTFVDALATSTRPSTRKKTRDYGDVLEAKNGRKR